MDKLHQTLRKEYESQEKKYLEKFGEHSLDNVSVWEPQSYPDDWKDILPRATDELKVAVQTGIPLEEDPMDIIY
ncbi:hypothetical protein MKL29_03550 [Streptococcus suis]|nr:hypothetical protein [Streptococcus suis]